MPEEAQPNNILPDILKVLQRIEKKLDGHEARFADLEDSWKNENRSRGRETAVFSSQCEQQRNGSASDVRLPIRFTKDNEKPLEDAKSIPKIPYGEWGWSRIQMDRFSKINLPPSLEQRLGDCWRMPDDDRLPLKFFRSNILNTNPPSRNLGDNLPTARQPFERKLEFVCRFDRELRKQPGNDFMVVDFDSDNTRLYRVGDAAIGGELQVEQGSHAAQWSRMIFYQGATTGDSIHPDKKRP